MPEKPLFKGINISSDSKVIGESGVAGAASATFGNTDFGASKFDAPNLPSEEIKGGEYQHIRGELQPVKDKWANGITQAAGKTLTSFAEGTAGTIYGVGAMLGSPLTEGEFKFSKLYDNAITQSLDKIGETIGSHTPLYQTGAYQNMSIGQKLLTANMWAGDILSGAGYTLGALGTGKLSGGAYRAIAKGLLGTTGKIAQAGEALTVATTSAIGESGEEGRQAGAEWETKTLAEIRKQYHIADDQPIPQNILDDIKSKKMALENSVFAINLPIIAGTNFLEFGKSMSNLKAERQAAGEISESIAKKIEQKKAFGEFSKIELSPMEERMQKILKIGEQPFEEGFQESEQTGTSTGVQDFYTKKFNNQETSIVDSAIKGAKEAFGTQKGWESFVVGALSTLVSGGVDKNSTLRQSFKSDAPDVKAALETLNKFKFSDVFNENVKQTNRANAISQDMTEAAIKNDKYEFNNAQNDYMTSLVLSRLKTDKLESLKEEYSDLETMSPEEFSKFTGVPVESREEVQKIIKDRIEKTDGIAHAFEQVEQHFPDYSEGNKERLIHAATSIDDSKKRKKTIFQQLYDISVKESSNFIMKFGDALYFNPTGSTKYETVATKEQTNEWLNTLNPLRKEEAKSLLEDFDKLTNREKEYTSLWNDITKKEEVRKKNDESDKKNEEKDIPPTPTDVETSEETSVTLKPNQKVQFRGKGSEEYEIESVDEQDPSMVYLKGDPNTPIPKTDLFIPSSLPNTGKESLYDRIFDPETGERKDGSGIHALGTKDQINYVLNNDPRPIEDKTSVTLTKNVSVGANLKSGRQNFLGETPKELKATLGPNTTLDIVYNLQDPNGEWFDATHGAHTTKYVTVDEKGVTTPLIFNESNRKKIKDLFNKFETKESLTDEEITEYIKQQEQITKLNAVYQKIFNERGEITLSAKELKEQYGVIIYEKNGRFDTISDDKAKPTLSDVSLANMDGDFYIYDTLNSGGTIEASTLIGAKDEIKSTKAEELVNSIKNPNNFIGNTNSRYIAIGQKPNGQTFLFPLDTIPMSQDALSSIIEDILSKESISDAEKNKINDEITSKLHIIAPRGTRIELKLDTKDEKPSKFVLVTSKDGIKTYYDVPLSAKTTFKSIAKAGVEQGLKLQETSFRNSIAKNNDETPSIELAKQFLSNVSKNVFEYSKIIAALDPSFKSKEAVYQEKTTNIPVHPEWRTWDEGAFEGQVDNKENKEAREYYTSKEYSDEIPPGSTESFNNFITRIYSAYTDAIENYPNNTKIVTSSQVLKVISSFDFKSGEFNYDKYNTIDIKAGEQEKIKTKNGVLFLVRHGITPQNKEVKTTSDLIRTKNTELDTKGIKDAKKEAIELPKGPIISGPLIRQVETAEILNKPETPSDEELTKQIEDLEKSLENNWNEKDAQKRDDLLDILTRGKDIINPEDTLNKISSTDAQVLIDIPEAKEWLNNNLPKAKVIVFDDVNKVLKNIESQGITWGFFKDKVIYLSEKAEKGTEFHEAFHYVFRTLLSNDEINQLYNVAKSKYGIPSIEQLKELKHQSSANSHLNKAELTALFYEEKMADQFTNWKKHDTKLSNLGLIGKLIAKLEDLYNWIRGNSTELEALFGKINNGELRNSDVNINNIFTKITDPVFKQIPNGKKAIEGKVEYTYTGVEEGRQIIRTIAAQVVNKLSNVDISTKDAILSNVIAEAYNFNNPSLDTNKALIEASPATLKDKTYKKLKALQFIYSNEESVNIIKDQVTKLLDTFNFIPVDQDFDQKITDEENERKMIDFDKNAINLGGIDGLNKEIRAYIGSTLMNGQDLLGRNVQVAVDPQVVYQGIERTLSNTFPENMMSKLKIFSEDNPQSKAVYERLVKDTGYDETLGKANLNLQLLQNFLNSFTKEKLNYLQILLNPTSGDVKILNANTKDAANIQFSEWLRNFDNLSQQYSTDNLARITKAINALKSQNEDKTATIKHALASIGIDISETYIKFSLSKDNSSIVIANPDVTPLKVEDLEELKASLARKESPFEKGSSGEKGVVTRLLNIASANAQFDENISSSNFQDSKGKTRYSYIQPSLTLERTKELKEQLSSLEGREAFKTLLKEKYSHDYSFNNDNYLLNHKNADELFSKFEIEFTGDIRQDEPGVEGATFKDIDSRAFKLMQYTLFSDIKKRGELKVARFYPKVLEASASAYSIQLPIEQYITKKNTPTSEAIETLYKQFLQEIRRISITEEEIASPKVVKVRNYHEGKLRGLHLFYFKHLEQEPYAEKMLEIAKSYTKRSDMYDLEDSIKHSIEQNLIKEIAEEKKSLENLGILQDKSLLPSSLRENIDGNIANFYINSLINLNAYNDLIELNPNFSKDFNDNTKRAKRWIAAKTNFGKGQHIVGFIEEPIAQGLTKQIDIADAQAYIDINHAKFILNREGKLSEEVNRIYDKINDGENLTWDEVLYLTSKGAALNSIKTVTSGPVDYHKMSDVILTRKLTSIKNDKGEWVAAPGKEKLHEIRIQLENLSRASTIRSNKGFQWKANLTIDQLDNLIPARIIPPSASKLLTYVPVKPNEDGRYTFDKTNTRLIDNKYSGRQVDTPSGKTQIVYGTQLIQLIDSEQDDNTKVEFRGQEVTIGDLRKIYQNLLGQARTNSVNQAKKFLGKLIDRQLTEKEENKFRKKLLDTLEESGADDSLLQFFGLNPKYNLNLPNTLNKYEQLFLAHFTKGVLSQKIAGLKLTLISGFGYNILDEDGKTYRELKYIPNGLSEVALPAFTKELHNLNPGDIIKAKDVLEMFGQRIPTQDKHSMIAFKVVEFLPSEYGSVGIFPKEIVELSGADFDIDSVFVERKDFYTEENGTKFIPFSKNTFEEFIKDNSQNNKDYQKLIKKGVDPQFALQELQLPSTKEEFKKATEEGHILSNAMINNQLVDINIKMLTNAHMIKEGIPQTPATTDGLKEVRDKILALQLGEGVKRPIYNMNSPLGQFTTWKQNSTGKENVGPAANSNLIRAFLYKNKVHLQKDTFRPIINGHKLFDFSKNKDNKGIRIQDTLSTILSAMTDNAKDPMAGDLNLSLTSLGASLQLISLGVDLYDVMLLMNQPIVKEYTEAKERQKTVVKSKDESEARKNIKEEFVAKYKLTSSSDLAIDTKSMESDINNINSANQGTYLDVFTRLEEQGKYWQHLSKLLALNKGLPASFKDTATINNAIEAFKLNSTEPIAEDAPFDIRNALKGSHILKNVHLYESIMDLSKQYFITQSTLFQSTIEDIKNNIKENIQDKPRVINQVKLDLLSYLSINLYNKEQERSLPQDLIIGENNITKQFKDLVKTYPELKNNKLIKFLHPQKASKTSSLEILAANSRIKLSGSQLEELTDSFRELYISPISKEFAKNLFDYLLTKDNLQYKNDSFIKFISPFMFLKLSKTLDGLNNTIDGGDFTQQVNDFKDIWFRHIENQKYIQKPSSFKEALEAEIKPEYIIFKDKTGINLYKLNSNKDFYDKSSAIGNDIQSPYGFKNAEEVEKNSDLNTPKYSKELEDEQSIESVERITPILEDLKTRFSLDYEIVDTPDVDWKGKFENNKVIINSAKVTLDTAFHEFSHPFVSAIRESNKPQWTKLLIELDKSDYGKDVLNKVKSIYPELDEISQKEEAIVTLIGAFAADIHQKDEQGLWDSIKEMLQAILDLLRLSISPKELSGLSMRELAALVAKGEKIDVSKSIIEEAKQKEEPNKEKINESAHKEQMVFFKRKLRELQKKQSLYNSNSEEYKKLEEEINNLTSKFNTALAEDDHFLYQQLGEETLQDLEDNIIKRLETGNLAIDPKQIEYAKDVIEAFEGFKGLLEKHQELKERLFPFISEYILDQVVDNSTEKEVLTQESIDKQNKDIGTWKSWVGALADSPNYIARTIGGVIKTAQNKVETANKELAKEIQTQVDNIQEYSKKAGIASKDVYNVFIQEHNNTAVLTLPSTLEFYSSLYEAFNNIKSLDAKKKEEGRIWLKVNASRENGEWRSVNTKYSNPNWNKIQSTPELKAFYDFYQKQIEESQKFLPVKFGKNYIPNIKKESAGNILKKLLPIRRTNEGGLIISEELEADIIPSKYHKKLSFKDKSTDLGVSLFKFGAYANNHDEMTSILPNVRLLQDGLVYKKNSKGEIVKKEYIKSSDPKTAIPGDKTNLYKQVDTIINMQVLGEMKLDQGAINISNVIDENGKTVKRHILASDLADIALKYNSILRIGFSPITAAANIIFGDISNIIEAFGSRFFTTKGLHQAGVIFSQQAFKEDSVLNKLLIKHNLLQELDDYSLEDSVSNKQLSPEKVLEYAYSMQKGGEKWLQSRTALAIMIKDEYLTSSGELTEKYNKASEKELEQLTDKIQRINQMIHGRYSQKEAAAIQQNAIYRVVSQFRKWIPAYLESRFNEKQWDNRLQEFTEGRFRTLIDINVYKKLLSGEKLTELESYNMKKNLTELILWAATAFSYSLIHGGDDEEAKRRRKNPYYKLGMTLLNRASGDLGYFYKPTSATELASKAVPLATTASTVIQAISYLPGALGKNNTYKTGTRRGKNKFLSAAERSIPGVKLLDEAGRILSDTQLEELK